MVHLSAVRFGLRAGAGGAACATFVAGDTVSERRTDDVCCPECWRAYALDRAVRLSAAQIETEATWAAFAELLAEYGLRVLELEDQVREHQIAAPVVQGVVLQVPAAQQEARSV